MDAVLMGAALIVIVVQQWYIDRKTEV